MDGAKCVLFNITGGLDLSLMEVNEAAEAISRAVDPDAKIIFGAVIDEKIQGEVVVTVLATGFGVRGLQYQDRKVFEPKDAEIRPVEVKPFVADLDIPAFLRRR